MTIDQLALLTWRNCRSVVPKGMPTRRTILHAREAAERMIQWFYPRPR